MAEEDGKTMMREISKAAVETWGQEAQMFMGGSEILGWLFVGLTLGLFIGSILGYRVGIYKGNGGV